MSVEQELKAANAAFRAGDWAQAERRYRDLVAAKPLEAQHNLGVLYQSIGRFSEARAAFEAALAVSPGEVTTEHALAILVLAEGDYREGFRLYEARRRVPGTAIEAPRPGYPEWRGEDLAGAHILVVREQGLGDQIQFARYIPELERRGAKVTYLCDPALVALFRSNGVDAVGAERGQAYPRADYWVMLYTLPHRLEMTLEGLSGAPYLQAEAIPGGGVGVKARGSEAHRHDRFRSLSDEAAARLEILGRDLDPAATGATDFLQTARIVAGLERVITVDTAVAHLAGALGKPVWIALSALHTDWRWLRDRDDSPWYGSARLYRQTTPDDWDPVLRRIETDLA
jgi:tetratricopeptide (TPR) repeat protein